MAESAQTLEELVMIYDDIDNSLPGQGKEMVRATVQNSLRLASKLKASPMHHMTLAALSRWLKQQDIEIEKAYESLDDFSQDVREMEVCTLAAVQLENGTFQLLYDRRGLQERAAAALEAKAADERARLAHDSAPHAPAEHAAAVHAAPAAVTGGLNARFEEPSNDGGYHQRDSSYSSNKVSTKETAQG